MFQARLREQGACRLSPTKSIDDLEKDASETKRPCRDRADKIKISLPAELSAAFTNQIALIEPATRAWKRTPSSYAMDEPNTSFGMGNVE
jgi:hypothetical protein